MTIAQNKIFAEALSLPIDLRTQLVEKLLSSLNIPTQNEIEDLWNKEAEHRVAQIENNEVKLIPGEVVFTKIREKFNR